MARKLKIVGSYQLNDGGHPFENDDIAWLQGGITETVRDVIDSFIPNGTPICVLKGLGVSFGGSTTSVTDGVMLLDNEVYSYSGTTQYNFPPQALEFYVREQTPKGSRNYANGSVNVVHVLETISVRAESTGSPYTNPMCLVNFVGGAGNRLEKFLVNKLDFTTLKNRLISDWYEVGGVGNPIFQNSFTSVSGFPFSYRYNYVTKRVEFQGKLTGNAALDDPIVCRLQLPEYPAFKQTKLIMGDTSYSSGNLPDQSFYRLTLYPNGDLRVVILESSTPHSLGICMDGAGFNI